jgi:hypothetical protein
VDFAKLAALLSSRALFFCQVPLLGDPFEGSLTKWVRANAERMRPLVAQQHPDFVRTGEESRNSILSARAYTYASCWHANERESAAMWDLYARSGFRVAVRSTIGRLIDAAAVVPEPVWIGYVRYCDYDSEEPRENSLWTPMLQKRKSFEHEREVRVLVMDRDRMTALRSTWRYEPNPIPGRAVPFDLGVMLEGVYIAPHAPRWFHDTVAAVSRAFGWLDLPIVQSEMEATPIF